MYTKEIFSNIDIDTFLGENYMNSTAKSSKRKIGKIAIITAICLILIGTIIGIVYATSTTWNKAISPSVKSYQMPASNPFDKTASDAKQVSVLPFGSATAGTLSFEGDTEKGTAIVQGYESFGINEDVSLTYTFDTLGFIDNSWIFTGYSHSYSNCAYVDGIYLGWPRHVGNGAIVVRKSLTGKDGEWTSTDWKNNVDFRSGDPYEICKIPIEDVKNGVYYRVTIVYEIVKDNNYIRCVEESNFFVCDNRSYVEFGSMTEGGRFQGDTTVPYGFTLYNNDHTNTVKVKVPSGNTYDFTENVKSYYTKGNYTITETTLAGKNHVTRVKVENGLTYKHISGKSYNTANDAGYVIKDGTANGSTTYAEPIIFVPANGTVNKIFQNGKQIFGVTGERVFVTLRLPSNRLPKITTGTISSDTWGATIDQKVDGTINTGVIGTGALIIQKSNDGVNWTIDEDEIVNGENQLYKDAVFTTDYQNSYGQDIINTVYTPKGNDIINYKYFRILYVYEVEENGIFKNYIEEFVFSLCIDDPKAVVFKNLTTEGEDKNEKLEGFDETYADIIRKSSTLTNESQTITGFRIDNSLNKSATISITKNGTAYKLPSTMEITEDGKYVITINSSTGKKEATTIYVTRIPIKEIYEIYFGECFLDGKRVYSRDSEVPVYVADVVTYKVNSAPANRADVWGKITNKLSTKPIDLVYDQNVTLTSAGVYEAVFNTNKTYATSNPSGDNYKITFRFKLITKDAVPGPVVNKEALEEFVKNQSYVNTVTGYYGVTYQAAPPTMAGVTVAFATYDKAIRYAELIEANTVITEIDEKTGEKYYKYNDSTFYSLGDVNIKIKQVAESLVGKEMRYFDATRNDKITTLPPELLYETDKDGNKVLRDLRKLNLSHEVVLFGDFSLISSKNDLEISKNELKDSPSEFEQLFVTTKLPILNSQRYRYLYEGTVAEGEDPYKYVKDGYVDFVFKADKNNFDSKKVIITSRVNNQDYQIKYDVSVEEQLNKMNCPTGPVSIYEETKYGDSVIYDAYFIANGENNTKITVSYDYENGKEEKTIFQGSTEKITAYKYSLDSIIDEYDPYGTIRVTRVAHWTNDDGTEEYRKFDDTYSYDDLKGKTFRTKGTHTITVSNRYGYSYTFEIEVESVIFSIDFEGEGTDDMGNLDFAMGDKIELPNLVRYGYNFDGYLAPNGAIYKNEIETIELEGNAVLTAVWSAKQFKLTYMVDGEEYKVDDITFDQTKELETLSSTSTKRFVGWKNEETGEKISTLSVQTEGDVTLVAEYEYTVTFQDYDTEGSEEITFVGDDQVKLPTPTRYGYNLAGFKGDDESIYAGTVKGSDLKNCTTLTAIWTPKTITVVLNKDNAQYQSLNGIFDTDLTLPVLDDTEEARFLGWKKSGSNAILTSIKIDTEEKIQLDAVFELKEDVSGGNESNPQQPSTPSTPPVDDNPTQDPSDTDPTPPQNEQKQGLEWWQITIGAVILAVALLIGLGVTASLEDMPIWIAYFVSGILAITGFVLMCIFVPWAWWLITLAVVGGFILLFFVLALIFEGIANAL